MFVEKARLNTALYRPLQNGQAYDKYFVKSDCTSRYLGTGSTDLTMSKMKTWAKRYVSHTREIAPVLKGKSLKQTAGNIHRFLYHNIQYKIDDYAQRLKSPACTWATRKEGADCKSYSIFASSILLNLGIGHYLRKVRQPHLNPKYWTHVYVVIPKDQKTMDLQKGYYVIDATLASNKEVLYIQKKDIKMNVNLPNYGLSGPGSTGHSYNFIDFSGGKQFQSDYFPEYNGQYAHGLGATAYKEILAEAAKGFEHFLALLSAYSSSDIAVRQLKGLIYDKLNKGIDPVIKITRSGIQVDGLFVNLKQTFKNLRDARQGGLGFVDENTTESLLSALLPEDFFESTFGAIFANGFDLSCWNSALPTNKVQADITQHHLPHFQKLQQAIDMATTLSEKQAAVNRFLRDAYVAYAHYADPSFGLLVSNNWSKCSRKGIQKHIEFQQEIKDIADSLIATLVQRGAVKTMYPVSPVTITLEGKTYGKGRTTASVVQVPQLTLTGADLSETFVDKGAHLKTGNTNVQQAGAGTTTMLLFTALILGGLFYGTKKTK